MGYEMKTKNGYNLFDMSSMLQKAIRRADVEHAAYAANEISVKYRKYLWKRLLTVSAEDCYGVITKEIIALQQADEYVNKTNKPGDTNDLFIAKAVILLCMARKNRDADYVTCNFMSVDRTLTQEEFEEYVDYEIVKQLQLEPNEELPNYIYDCHTLRGKMNGKTKKDMIIDEQKALNPHQMNLFDNASWDKFLNRNRR